MPKIKHILTIKQKRQHRVRVKLHGTATRPRLCVTRSNKYCYLQVIDDVTGKTVASASDAKKENKMAGNKTERAQKVAENIAGQLGKKKIKALVFDRGHYRYHGRVKAVAESLRQAGLKL